MKNIDLSNELKNFGVWLGKNHFGRNSFGVWSTNCISFGGFSDAEIVEMYMKEPNKYQDFKKKLHKKLYPDMFI